MDMLEETSERSAEILETLEKDIEEKGRVPTIRDLKGEGCWNLNSYDIEEAYRGLNNALWHLGIDPHQVKLVNDGDRELLRHEIRGIEHEEGRAPKQSEVNRKINGCKKYDELNREVPYRTLAKEFGGFIDPEREDELVEALFVDLEDPLKLVREGEAFVYEVDLVSEAYIDWVDETYSPGSDDYSFESAENLPETVFEMVAEDYNQGEIKNELDLHDYHIRPLLNEMKDLDLIDTEGSRGTFLTSKGEKIYSSEDYRSFFRENDFTTYEDL